MNESLSQIIYELLGETYQKYGFNWVEGAVYEGITNGNFNGFTNTNSVRAKLVNYMNNIGETVTSEKTGFNYTFFEGIMDCYLENITKENNPKTDFERNILATAERFKAHPRGREITRNHLISKAQIDMNSVLMGREYDSKRYIAQMISRVCECHQKAKVHQMQVSNIKVHNANIQRVRELYISGLTRVKEGRMQLGKMQACTSIGRKRRNQEDAVLIKEHAQNSKFKLLVVSDGMGGAQAGEEISNYTINEISKWFDNVPVAYYKVPDKLAILLEKQLKTVSETVAGKYSGNGGATFVGAIVCESDTIVTNVGDSRAYTYNRATNQLNQCSKDHSFVEELYQIGVIQQHDDMRFHMKSNHITQYIGMKEEYNRNLTPSTLIIPNQQYDQLILVSDGVSDCLSNQDILVITQRTPREKLAQMLVNSALENTSIARKQLDREMYYDKIVGGKDNTSAVVFDNDR